MGAIGVGALAAATAAVGAPGVLVAEGAVSVVVGLMVGASRRQYVERTFQAEQLLAERVRADAERDRAAALAERNRIGREVHDVLAHSLGALSVQLDAADALLENGDDHTKARQLVQQARRLAVQGLEETRQAVHALRDEPVALAEQLSSLAARDGAELTVTGAPRPLAPDAGLALYRAAQEAVTNARKHAPGAPVSIFLDFDPKSTTLRVTNGLCPDADTTSELQHDRRRIRPARHARADRTAGWPGRAEPSRSGLDRPGGGAGVRVVVADDQTVVREGLVTLLETMPGIEVVGSASDGEEAVALVAELCPEVVLMDLRMPRVDGVEATKRIRADHPGTQVVVLTTYADDESIVGALRAGAIGYLTKDAGRDHIGRALEAAASGQAVLDPAVQARLVDVATLPGTGGEGGPLPDGLTEREAEVLRLIAAGRSNAEIGSDLFVSEATVKTHVNRIFAKTGSRDRSQAVAYAHRHGLVGR